MVLSCERSKNSVDISSLRWRVQFVSEFDDDCAYEGTYLTICGNLRRCSVYFACGQDYGRDYSNASRQVEHAMTVFWAMQKALRRISKNDRVHEFVLYVDSFGSSQLHFGLKFSETSVYLLPTLMGSLHRTVVFGDHKPMLMDMVAGAMKMFTKLTGSEFTMSFEDRNNVSRFVRGTGDIPKQFFDPDCDNISEGSLAALFDDFERMIGERAPYTTKDVFT